MRLLCGLSAGFAAIPFFAGAMESAQVPREHAWSLSLYAGPATTKYFGAILQGFDFQPRSVMIGLAANRPFLDLGWGIALSGELQVTQYVFGHRNTSFAAGLGIRANEPFGLAGTSLSIHDGPSYALNPPHTSIGYGNTLQPSWRKKFLNYVSIEFAVSLSQARDWDGVFRVYHRSGAFGLFSRGNDDGAAIGFGVRHNF